jgi:hypothetical protein
MDKLFLLKKYFINGTWEFLTQCVLIWKSYKLNYAFINKILVHRRMEKTKLLHHWVVAPKLFLN